MFRILQFRKYYIQRLIDIYEKEVNTGRIPHLYSIGVFTILDFFYILGILMLFGEDLNRLSCYLIITFLLILNYLIYKYVKSDSFRPISKHLIYVYLALPIIFFLIIVLFGGLIK